MDPFTIQLILTSTAAGLIKIIILKKKKSDFDLNQIFLIFINFCNMERIFLNYVARIKYS